MLAALRDQLLRRSDAELRQIHAKQHQVEDFVVQQLSHVFAIFGEFRAHL